MTRAPLWARAGIPSVSDREDQVREIFRDARSAHHAGEMRRLDYLILPIYLLVSFALRLPSFYWTSIDWDESLYFLMAKGLLHGDSLYLTVWENKPPGIYLIFALSQAVFGSTVFAARIAACIAVAVIGELLYRFGRAVLSSREVGLVAGVFEWA